MEKTKDENHRLEKELTQKALKIYVCTMSIALLCTKEKAYEIF